MKSSLSPPLSRVFNWLLWFLAATLPFYFFFTRAHYLGDPMVDIGSEIYVAQRVWAGEVLYRDLFYYFGPFTPYWNAFLFSFGFSPWETLLVSNFFFYLAILFLLSKLIKPLATGAGLPLALIFVSVVFGFNQTEANGNFNYLTPYRSATIHSLFFALASLTILRSSLAKGTSIPASISILSGLAIGLSFIAKPESFLAGSITGLVAIAFSGKISTDERRIKAIAGWLAGYSLLIVTVVGAFTWAHSFSARDAASSLLSPYALMSSSSLRQLPFYQAITGSPSPSWLQFFLLVAAYWTFLLGVPSYFLGKWRHSESSVKPGLLLGTLGMAVLIAPLLSLPMNRVARSYGIFSPSLAALVFLFLAWSFFRRRRQWSERQWCLAQGSLFGTILASRIWFLADSTFYGFTLALPCMLLVFLLAVGMPEVLKLKLSPRNLVLWRTYAVLLFLPHALGLHQLTGRFLQLRQDVSLGNFEAFGNFHYYPEKGRLLVATASYLRTTFPEAATFNFLPDGNFMNVLLAKPSTLYPMSLLPDQVLVQGTQTILEQLRSRPADVVVLMPVNTSEFGVGDFATGYGKDIFHWVTSNYCRRSDLPETLRAAGLNVYATPPCR